MVDKGEGDSTSRRPQVADQCGHERILGNKGTKIEAVRKGVFGVAPVNVAKSVMRGLLVFSAISDGTKS